ncbi:unnamed protein product [Kuraishia capsulata CBS 1993]|uniref:Transcription factor CPH1 n=1 Tax=Kuraishia capsulata CBS 1993 TaxID=1382522 RepID=W6MFX0_9ASCO|nr:uncharacterized protein KUCA_T00000816001 [Kuraishia capsulata CBS 1993]CDK24849.1 unnamed protein product [Kuraishia capsulata CBS 1993]
MSDLDGSLTLNGSDVSSALHSASSPTDANMPTTEESVRRIEDLKFFLATAPANWQENQIIRRYFLNREEGFVSCVFWNNLYFITGTDIVRCVVFKFEHFGRKIIDRKKFEEGIFSDLRNLKCGRDAVLETPKSDFLQFLQKNQCLRTQKKQKVFFWFSVPHDKLFTDALERDLTKEQKDQVGSTEAVREPALSFAYNLSTGSVPLFDQLSSHLDQKKYKYPAGAQETQDTVSGGETPLELDQAQLSVDLAALKPVNEESYASPLQIGVGSGVKHHRISLSGEVDDDFPLDYFFAEGAGEYSNAYPVEEVQPFGLFGDPYISYGQPHPTMFVDPGYSAGLNRGVYGGDPYLLEQTTPVVPVSMSATPRAKVKLEDPHEMQKNYIPEGLVGGYNAYDDDYEPLVGAKYPEYYYAQPEEYAQPKYYAQPNTGMSPYFVASPQVFSPYVPMAELGTGFPPMRATIPSAGIKPAGYGLQSRSMRVSRPQSALHMPASKISKNFSKKPGKAKLSNPNLQHVDLETVFNGAKARDGT